MRKSAWILTLAILILLSLNVAFAFQNEPDGFRGLKWGDPPTEDMIVTEFLNEKEDAWNQCFYRPNDKMFIGSVPVLKITYSFYYSEPAKLMSVTMLFEKQDDYELLKTILEGTFGKTTKSTMPFFAWKDLWIGGRTVIELSFKVLGKGKLKFYSPQILKQKKKTDEQKEIDEAKGDF